MKLIENKNLLIRGCIYFHIEKVHSPHPRYGVGIYEHGEIFDHLLKGILLGGLSYTHDGFHVINNGDLIFLLSDDEILEHIVLEMI